MKLNKLIDNETRQQRRLNLGRSMDETRCSGRSTGRALQVLADAMEHPGTWVKAFDHTDPNKNLVFPNNARNKFVAIHAMEIAKALELMHFIRIEDEIKYDVFWEV